MTKNSKERSFRSDQVSRSVVSDSLRPHKWQHTRPPCPSPTPRVHSNSQAGIKIAGRNINNLRWAGDTTLIAESEELKSLLMKVKEESEKADPEGWYREGGGRGVQDGEHMYARGRFMFMCGRTNTIF